MVQLLKKISFYSSILKQERIIRIYLPNNYEQANEEYPVLYMHDGQNVFNDEEAIKGNSLRLEDYLNQNALKVIVVAIDLNLEERMNEYCPWVIGEYSERLTGEPSSLGGKGKQYIEFIVSELIPYIEQQYRTNKAYSAMAGISLGGLIATYAACTYPNLFKNISVFSSAFFRNQEEIEVLLRESDLSSIESFYMDCGTKESANNEEISNGFLASNQAIYEIINQKLPQTNFSIITDGEHNYDAFRERVPALFHFLSN
ncbi:MULTISPECIES: alpha/beta hydrolase [unclassified Bacillus (in: firmicutes)]|uniref:alpha/beta hydrolase n=1 Tax=unclassified Bacillus (in: firmicutes) TaxID=185979 RepID=UPI0008E1A957|nr:MULTISPECIES: alpha/beta hydrolase-fold protein [unclassified Bacillus (in: firmicutes)]SFA87267.1 Predicted hydrolase of the alpha/beta superfamily [Bacillus sp. UNCCL13]SFQ84146.1 Predicted hydrolase of the alpha/beta superfamily [Bacillus sp. cl95]